MPAVDYVIAHPLEPYLFFAAMQFDHTVMRWETEWAHPKTRQRLGQPLRWQVQFNSLSAPSWNNALPGSHW